MTLTCVNKQTMVLGNPLLKPPHPKTLGKRKRKTYLNDDEH